MAEYIMKDLVRKAGLESQFQIVLRGDQREELGNPVYPPAQRKLAEHGIGCSCHAARQLVNSDYEKYDLLIGMDQANLRDMYRICGGDFADRMHPPGWTTHDRPGHGSGRPVVHRQLRSYDGGMCLMGARGCLTI